MTQSICRINEYVQTLGRLGLDEKEFSFLRAIALFGADQHAVERLQDKAVVELERHCSARPGGPDRARFPRLLLLLSPLRSLQPDTLEDLFFSGLIGNIQIDSVIPYILKMEPREYQTHLGRGEGGPAPRPAPRSPPPAPQQNSQLKVELNFISAEDSDNLPNTDLQR